MHIVISGASSYYCAQLTELRSWLEREGYQPLPGRSQYEYGRWQLGRSLLILYHNGTVLLQGADTHTPRALFARLLADTTVQAELPF